MANKKTIKVTQIASPIGRSKKNLNRFGFEQNEQGF